MEGISQIRSYRELWAAFPDYWDSGRAATTADAVAAINGLAAGGATSITVCEVHGPVPGTIIDLEELPHEAIRIDQDELLRQLPRGRAAFDALFLLGWHARCGTTGGFMSHTGGLSLRIAVDGNPITEAHIYALRASVPVIGITGDAALEGQLDGILEGTPFLAVKKAITRAEAEPLYPPEGSATAIEAFASWCVKNISERGRQRHPDRMLLSISMPPKTADLVDGTHGLRRTSPAIMAASVTDWWYDAEPAVRAAQEMSFMPWRDAADDIGRFQNYLTRWSNESEAEWLT
jgi:D-aminopeptidase